MVTEDSGVQLTPTSTKCNNKLDNDMMSILLSQFDKMNCKFDEQNSKFDKLSSDVSEVKSSFEEQNNNFDTKFDELKIYINNVKNKCCLLYTSRCV